MTTVESRVVDPVTRRSSVNPVEVSETQMVEDALQHEEEEKMLEDEEIDSCEGEDLDEHILNAALVKSVVDSGVQSSQSQSSARYGLRRRRRPGDAVGDVETSPTLKPQVPAEASSSGRTATITNGRLSLVGPTVVTTLGDQQSQQAPTGGGVIQSSGGVDTGGGTKTNVPVSKESGERGSETSGEMRDQSTVQVKPDHQVSAGSAASRLAKPEAVPLTVNVFSKAQSRHQNAASSRESEVPLLVRVDQATQGVRVKVEDTKSNLQSVPRLKPEQAPVEKKVTISEPPTFQRNRIFSVDLDPGTFDFSDMAGDPTDMTRGDPDMPDLVGPVAPDDEGGDDLAIFKRDRAFSFEFFNFAGDDLLPAPPAAAPAPLPELPEAPVSEDVVSSRPRGESIIFDPTSFQDGGIHEKSAMLVTAAKKPEPPSSVGSSTVSRPAVPVPHVVAPPPPPPAAAAVPRSYPTPDVSMSNAVSGGGVSASIVSTSILDNGPVATLPSGLAMGNNANGNTPPTFQMELLNKDGRIGIYLPEDRRERIARFHAKRKMRIWRKRIKYDCRKKLADSRPRIKGRFVKRSDMDDEV
eukprot:Nitzschia sp. Nitz4//scaffold191_size41780//27197//29007//NITZ4_007472-RA/size41780-processed-gene-0.72-mRNA-1//1//CDS//3329540196//4908//frame0